MQNLYIKMVWYEGWLCTKKRSRILWLLYECWYYFIAKSISSQQVVLPQQQQMKQTSNKKSSKTNSKQKVSPQIILRRNFQRQQPLFATRWEGIFRVTCNGHVDETRQCLNSLSGASEKLWNIRILLSWTMVLYVIAYIVTHSFLRTWDKPFKHINVTWEDLNENVLIKMGFKMEKDYY